MDTPQEITPEQWAKMPQMDSSELKALGFGKWAIEVLRLIPAKFYDQIPDGTKLVSISGKRFEFKKGETDGDSRYGMLAYGFLVEPSIEDLEIALENKHKK